MTNSFAHLEQAKMIFLIGSNTTEAHPVAGSMIKRAVRNGCRLIVADPRRFSLARHAERHLPLKVGSDVALLNGLMRVLITEDIYDKDYVAKNTEDFEALREAVMDYTPEKAGSICGIPAEEIVATARDLASVKPVMLIYTLGITEHTCGVNNVMSCANLQMLLGNVGFPLGGVNPLRGQNNVQGACDMGALPNVYTSYQQVTNPEARAKFEKFWEVEGLDDKIGLMMPAMMDGLKSKAVRCFYVFGENLANTEPDIHHVESCLEAAEFLVVQDIFHNETTRFAHVILPTAAWSENDGTYANSERRINRIRAVSPAPGQSRPSWWVFKQLAARFGQNWASDSARELWDNEISVLSPNLFGIKYARIEGDGLQWPCPSEDHPGTRVMHTEGKFTRGKGLFKPSKWTPPAEVADEEYPLVLSTGRRLYHYHTRTQTGRCAGLNELLGRETADISIEDAEALGIRNGELIRVSSRRGSVKVTAKVTDEIQKGLVWMAFHFRENNANWLTNPVFDPISKTAEYKACAVKIEKLPVHEATEGFPA
jgi:formate dehydrogenase major subunit